MSFLCRCSTLPGGHATWWLVASGSPEPPSSAWSQACTPCSDSSQVLSFRWDLRHRSDRSRKPKRGDSDDLRQERWREHYRDVQGDSLHVHFLNDKHKWFIPVRIEIAALDTRLLLLSNSLPLGIKQLQLDVGIRCTSDVHLLQFPGFQYSNWEQIFTPWEQQLALSYWPVSFPEDGTYLRERHRSPRYWLEPSSTGARSFHSWTGPARSTLITSTNEKTNDKETLRPGSEGAEILRSDRRMRSGRSHRQQRLRSCRRCRCNGISFRKIYSTN